ncbi:MAG: Uma2 family endonuclease, partial [Chloroflexota bacterium]
PSYQYVTKNGDTIDASKSGEHPLDENPLYVSEKTYWEKYYDHPFANYEWNNGKLEEKPPVASMSKFSMYLWLIYLLKSYLLVHQNADMVGLEVGFRLVRRAPVAGRRTTIRKPDMGVVRHDNPVPILPDDKTYRGIFDLCIESISDSNQEQIDRDTVDKFTEYAQAGVPEYYILDDHRNRHMEFYQLNASGVYIPMPRTHGGDVIQSVVLPGFQFRISDLFRRPMPIQLVNDPIYQHFILTEYQQERLRAQQEAQRARQEAQRAQQEFIRANRYAEQLRALGIDPDAI